MSERGYQRHYDVHLLDDLHNFFPALLYEPDRFRNVADVLAYVRGQVRRRFDLFSAGQREYSAGASRRPALPGLPGPAAAAPSPLVDNRAAFPIQPARNNRTAAAAAMEASGRQMVDEMAATVDLLNMFSQPMNPANAILSLMTGGGGGGGLLGLPAPFLEPVPVRPTAAQIDENTVVEIVDAEEEVCAICQDQMPAGSQARCLNACDHRFHVGCIDTWFQRDVHCPVCRHDVREPADEAAT